MSLFGYLLFSLNSAWGPVYFSSGGPVSGESMVFMPASLLADNWFVSSFMLF